MEAVATVTTVGFGLMDAEIYHMRPHDRCLAVAKDKGWVIRRFPNMGLTRIFIREVDPKNLLSEATGEVENALVFATAMALKGRI